MNMTTICHDLDISHMYLHAPGGNFIWPTSAGATVTRFLNNYSFSKGSENSLLVYAMVCWLINVFLPNGKLGENGTSSNRKTL